MKKIRFIPFGYMIDKGKLRIQDLEAGSVKIIYEEYIRGLSYNEIAAIMNNAGIPYNDESRIWNKNMVKRILDNESYVGNSTYPPLLSADQYIQVKKIKECKNVKFNKEELPYLDIIREKTVCYECGNKYLRLHDYRRSEKWYCKTNGCKVETTSTDALIISAVIAITNAVIANPSLLEIIDNESYQPSLEITKLNNEINRELDKKDVNYDQVKEMMLCCASKKYAQCKKLEPKEITQKLLADFHKRAPIDEFDPNIFNDDVLKLLIERTGRIHMQFINGASISYKQEIRKEK